jgi:hypothetical protein
MWLVDPKMYERFRIMIEENNSFELQDMLAEQMRKGDVMLAMLSHGERIEEWNEKENNCYFLNEQANTVYENMEKENKIIVNDYELARNACDEVGVDPDNMPWGKDQCGMVGVVYKKFGTTYRATQVQEEWGGKDQVIELLELLHDVLSQLHSCSCKPGSQQKFNDLINFSNLFTEMENADNRNGRNLRRLRDIGQIFPFKEWRAEPVKFSLPRPVDNRILIHPELPWRAVTVRSKIKWVPVDEELAECRFVYLYIWKLIETTTRLKAIEEENEIRCDYMSHCVVMEMMRKRLLEVQKDEMLDLRGKMDRLTVEIEKTEKTLGMIAEAFQFQTEVVSWRRWEMAQENMSVVMKQYRATKHESQHANEDVNRAREECDREKDSDNYQRANRLFTAATDHALEAAALYTSSQVSRERARKYISDTERQLK